MNSNEDEICFNIIPIDSERGQLHAVLLRNGILYYANTVIGSGNLPQLDYRPIPYHVWEGSA